MKKIAVLGGGISGYGSAILAKKKGFDVFLSDAGRIADRYKAKLDEWQVPLRGGRPYRRAHPRRRGGRQVARHSPKRRRWCENSAPQAFP